MTPTTTWAHPELAPDIDSIKHLPRQDALRQDKLAVAEDIPRILKGSGDPSAATTAIVINYAPASRSGTDLPYQTIMDDKHNFTLKAMGNKLGFSPGIALPTSCSEEVQSETSTGKAWLGGIVDYPSQESLRDRYQGVVESVGRYVYTRGYTGPLGFDVMSNNKGEDFVVDLNARPPGSFVLGVLKGHFWHRSGLPFVRLMFLILAGDRDGFEKQMWGEIAAGKILIVAWCRGELSSKEDRPYSVASIIVAEITRTSLMEAVARVKALGMDMDMDVQAVAKSFM